MKLCRTPTPATFCSFLSDPTLQVPSVRSSVLHMFSESTKLHAWTIKAAINQLNTLNSSLTPRWSLRLHFTSRAAQIIKVWIQQDARDAPQGCRSMLTCGCYAVPADFPSVLWSSIFHFIPKGLCLVKFWESLESTKRRIHLKFVVTAVI